VSFSDVRELFKAVRKRQNGATVTEYAIVLVMVAVGAVVAVGAFGSHLRAVWEPFASKF
jgi:Flp pilus assembly pilin Flp